MITLTASEAKFLITKLEYRFKKSVKGAPLVEKLTSDSDVELTADEISILKNKLEYRFKQSSNPILEKLKVETV